MTSTRIPALIAGLAIAATLGACSDMTPREHSTAVGAGVGAAAGAVLTGTPRGRRRRRRRRRRGRQPDQALIAAPAK